MAHFFLPSSAWQKLYSWLDVAKKMCGFLSPGFPSRATVSPGRSKLPAFLISLGLYGAEAKFWEIPRVVDALYQAENP